MKLLLRIFVFVIERLTHLISSGANQVSVSREEVSAMVTVGAEEGVLQKKENKMIQNLLKLDTITAHEIMTPSVVVEMADSSMTLKEFYKTEEFNMFCVKLYWNVWRKTNFPYDLKICHDLYCHSRNTNLLRIYGRNFLKRKSIFQLL